MSLIILELINNVCILTINRPDQYNALNEDVLKELDNNIQLLMPYKINLN